MKFLILKQLNTKIRNIMFLLLKIFLSKKYSI